MFGLRAVRDVPARTFSLASPNRAGRTTSAVPAAACRSICRRRFARMSTFFGGEPPRAEIEARWPVGVDDLQQQGVAAGLKLQRQLVLIGGRGHLAGDLLRQHLLPLSQTLIASSLPSEISSGHGRSTSIVRIQIIGGVVAGQRVVDRLAVLPVRLRRPGELAVVVLRLRVGVRLRRERFVEGGVEVLRPERADGLPGVARVDRLRSIVRRRIVRLAAAIRRSGRAN